MEMYWTSHTVTMPWSRHVFQLLEVTPPWPCIPSAAMFGWFYDITLSEPFYIRSKASMDYFSISGLRYVLCPIAWHEYEWHNALWMFRNFHVNCSTWWASRYFTPEISHQTRAGIWLNCHTVLKLKLIKRMNCILSTRFRESKLWQSFDIYQKKKMWGNKTLIWNLICNSDFMHTAHLLYPCSQKCQNEFK